MCFKHLHVIENVGIVFIDTMVPYDLYHKHTIGKDREKKNRNATTKYPTRNTCKRTKPNNLNIVETERYHVDLRIFPKNNR